jgi:phosphopantothenoylcysteine decarboxylase/phosphopantothenate--cysteine ligase
MKKRQNSLKGKNILLAVTGSVAAYKAIELARKLTDQEASVNVIMTKSSTHFATPLSFKTASSGKVYVDLFDEPMAHISLVKDADVMLVAPATANIIGKFATGIADDLVSTCLLSYRGTTIIAPAMNWRMYRNPTVIRNLDYLKAQGVVEVPPMEGTLACGEEGIGKMAEIENILDEVCTAVAERDFADKKIIVTAGPTREHLDSVRFISNRSTGKMGYALARAARLRGARVTLISGPSSLHPPSGIRFIPVISAEEMRKNILKEIRGASAVIMAAAVADIAPEKKNSKGKLDKAMFKGPLEIVKTPDILAELGAKKKRPVLVGFAAEAGKRLGRAREKLTRKGVDIMVFNDITEPGAGFETDTNKIVIMDKSGDTEHPLLKKTEAADVVLDRLVQYV